MVTSRAWSSRLPLIAWYGYLALLVPVLFSATLSTLARGNPTLLDTLDLPLNVVALVGVFGFVSRIRIGGRAFWRLFLPALLGWVFFTSLLLTGDLDHTLWSVDGARWKLAAWTAFLAPAGVALFLYAYGSQRIWEGEQAKPRLPRLPGYDTAASRWTMVVQLGLMGAFVPTIPVLLDHLHFLQVLGYAVVGGLLLGVLHLPALLLVARLRPQDFATDCRVCGRTRYGLGLIRPTSLRQLLRRFVRSSWTCAGCGSELDYQGNPVR